LRGDFVFLSLTLTEKMILVKVQPFRIVTSVLVFLGKNVTGHRHPDVKVDRQSSLYRLLRVFVHAFDRDIVLIKETPTLFRATITPNWSIKGVPNGEYLMALVANSMMQTATKRGTPILTANFVSRSEVGEAELHVERIARSKQFERYQTLLIQNGKERIRAFGTFTNSNESDSEKRYEKDQPQIAELEQCVVIPQIPKYSLFNHIDIRLDPSISGWLSHRPASRSEMKGWIRFREERLIDTLAIVIMADSFPPAVIASHGPIAWVPTIEMSLSIRSLPKTEWLKCVFKTNFIQNHILEEDGEICDSAGGLVAISRQYYALKK
jgi:hypothetical protein